MQRYLQGLQAIAFTSTWTIAAAHEEEENHIELCNDNNIYMNPCQDNSNREQPWVNYNQENGKT
jgi:hypothetical protein